MAFDEYGDRLLTACRDKLARIWDARWDGGAGTTGKLLLRIHGHTRDVLSASWSANFRRVVTTSKDRTARIWDARTGELQTKLTGHGNFVTGASFSPDGARLVTSSCDCTAKIWNVRRRGPSSPSFRGHRHPTPRSPPVSS